MQFFVDVVVLTSMYALLAIGYVIVYRATRVLNIAHGELMMLSAYLAFTLAGLLPGRGWLVVPLAILATSVLGVLVYRLLIRRMAGRAHFATILLTVALGIAIEGVVVLIWSPRTQYLSAALGIVDHPILLPAGAAISSLGLVTIAACLGVLGIMAAFLRYSRFGTQMRAAAENPLLVAQRGIDVERLFSVAWGVAVASAALAGILYALSTRLEGGMAIVGLKAFPAALVGGLGSLGGVLPAALLVAMAEVAAIQFVNPQLSNVAPFLVLLVALLVRPWGLGGSPEHIERA